MILTKQEVMNIITIHPKGNIQEKQFKKKFPELYQEIISLSFPEDFKWTQKLYHFFHDDLELNLGYCHICGKRCKFRNINLGYHNHCSLKCMGEDLNVKQKREETNIKNFGVKNVFQSEEIKEKIYKTNEINLGVKHPFQTKNVREKYKQTMLTRHGVEHNSQMESYQEKFQETCRNHWGVNNPFQSEILKQKSRDKCEERYGVPNYTQTNEYKEKYKQFCQEKWGCDNAFQAEEIKQKSKETCQKNWGVDNYAQSKEFAKYHRKRVEYDNKTFDSNWEVDVYKFCKEHDIPCEYQPNITLEYTYNNKKHYYHPDFLINGKLYEVKGDQFFDGDKMICPYNRDEYKDGLAEAKHQCMLQNGVIILRDNDIRNLDGVFL